MNDTSIPNQQTQILVSVYVAQVVLHLLSPCHLMDIPVTGNTTVVSDNPAKMQKEAVLS
jgi:hypothetical protein